MSASFVRRSAFVVALAVAIPTLLGACEPPPPPTRYKDVVFSGVTTQLDVTYGSATGQDGTEALKLDLYKPAGDTATNRPVIVWAHGGSFWMGDKASGKGRLSDWTKRGYVTASINYRMYPDEGPVTFPVSARETQRILDAKHDMQAAVRWFRANAVSLGIDPHRIAVGGGSAGAVTSVSVGVTPDDPGTSGNPGHSSAVCTVFSVSGATDPLLIGPGDAGAAFLHGTADTVVPFAAAEDTYDAMQANGITSVLIPFEGEGHGLSGEHGDFITAFGAGWFYNHLATPDPSCAGAT